MKKKLNPRQARTIRALMNSAQMRQNIDQIAGCSNSPGLISQLRRKGLEIPCERIERFDRDGNACRPGLYRLTPEDKAIVRDWLRNQSGRTTIIGGVEIQNRYELFIDNLPDLCAALQLTVGELIFNDYTTIIEAWLKENY